MSAIQQMLLAGAAKQYSLPTYFGTSQAFKASEGVSSLVVPAVASAQSGDICLVFVLSNNTSSAALSGYNLVFGSEAGRVFWRRLTGADSSVTVSGLPTGTGSYGVGIKVVVRGASSDADPIDSISNTGSAGSSTTLSFGDGGNAAANNTLYVAAAQSIAAVSTAYFFSTYSSASKTSITERYETHSAGLKGNFVCITANCVEAGVGSSVTSTTSQTLITAQATAVRVRGIPV